MNKKTHKIKGIIPGSIAEETGIEPGDRLICINGQGIEDILDYMEWIGHEEFELVIQKSNEEEWIIYIEKEPGEDIGIIFESPLLDKERHCANKCVFCFIDQLPSGMRKTLYYKDDDWRMSFLMGNYITLTNLSKKDIERIIEKHISPLYVSVHAIDGDLRQRMLNNPKGKNILNILRAFRDAGILVNCQIVLCRGWNDGCQLDNTIQHLWDLRDSVISVAVVPIGLTKYRENLTVMTSFDKDSARNVVEQVESWQEKFRNQGDTAFVFAADEFYMMADMEYPPYEAYEDFLQIENGVGLVTRFKREFEEETSAVDLFKDIHRKVSIATGISGYKVLKDIVEYIHKNSEIEVYLYPITNKFFGEDVTVTGLVTGQDIIDQLKGKKLGQELLIPTVMLKENRVFLDDITVKDVEKALDITISIVPPVGREFIEAVTGKTIEEKHYDE